MSYATLRTLSQEIRKWRREQLERNQGSERIGWTHDSVKGVPMITRHMCKVVKMPFNLKNKKRRNGKVDPKIYIKLKRTLNDKK